MVARQRGFEYRPEKPLLHSWVEQKWGWTGSEPGGWCWFRWEGQQQLAPAARGQRLSPSAASSHRPMLSLQNLQGLGLR